MILYILFVVCFLIWDVSFKCIEKRMTYLESARKIGLDTCLKFCEIYHWTLLRGPPRAKVPSIILCVKKWNLPGPQRGGSSHSGEGQNRRFHLIKTEGRGYKKIPLV